MLTAHRIELDPTDAVRAYFAQACGCARFTWNWALAEWNRQYAAGMQPNAMALKKQFNAIKYAAFPWMEAMHRDAHAQPFANLGKAFTKFFKAIKSGARIAPDKRAERKRFKRMGVKLAYRPAFKKKGKCVDAFYVANDKIHIMQDRIYMPRIGVVRMKEPLRFGGKVMGATISRVADRWFVSIQVEVEVAYLVPPDRREKLGVDVNTDSIYLSTGEVLTPPRPMKELGQTIRRLQRKASHKVECAKVASGIPKGQRITKDTRLPPSKNLQKLNLRIAQNHARATWIRTDFLHKTTTRLCRENQAVTIEDLSVQGMTASSKGTVDSPGRRVKQKSGLNRAILDVAPGEFRRQMTYKSQRYGTELTLADRFFPSSQLCSTKGCNYRKTDLTLKDRQWTCPQCGTVHDRDHNASKNLENYVPQGYAGRQA